MLVTPGDLIPVQPEATIIPWTRRKSQILNFLHRGPVTFSTLVYDTNVGDISSLATYFNPERVSVKDLNSRFGQHPSSGDTSREENGKVGSENVIKPRLLLYPEHNLNHTQVKVQRTLKWVLSHQDGEDSPDSARVTPVDNQTAIRSGSHDNLSVRTGSTDSLSRAGSVDVGRRHMSGPVSGGNLNQGLRPISRPASAVPGSRLTPIGHPLQPFHHLLNEPAQISGSDSSSVLGLQELANIQDIRASTMPNLGSALDRVWCDVPKDISISRESLDQWPMWEPTKMSW